MSFQDTRRGFLSSKCMPTVVVAFERCTCRPATGTARMVDGAPFLSRSHSDRPIRAVRFALPTVRSAQRAAGQRRLREGDKLTPCWSVPVRKECAALPTFALEQVRSTSRSFTDSSSTQLRLALNWLDRLHCGLFLQRLSSRNSGFFLDPEKTRCRTIGSSQLAVLTPINLRSGGPLSAFEYCLCKALTFARREQALCRLHPSAP